jgi:hypothetical protein
LPGLEFGLAGCLGFGPKLCGFERLQRHPVVFVQDAVASSEFERFYLLISFLREIFPGFERFQAPEGIRGILVQNFCDNFL